MSTPYRGFLAVAAISVPLEAASARVSVALGDVRGGDVRGDLCDTHQSWWST